MATLSFRTFYSTSQSITSQPFIPTITTLPSLSSPKLTFSLLSITKSTIPLAAAVRCSAIQNGTLSPNQRPEYIPYRISDSNYVRIFDTTLRDGEQSPGAAMTPKQKLEIARQLATLGVDIIEAGFPAASKADLEAVKSIAIEVGNTTIDIEDGYVPVICGLARCTKADIDAAWEAVKHAKRPRIHTFIATSEIHMQYKLKKSKEEVIEIARDMVKYARSLGCDDVEFSPEDAGRYNMFNNPYQLALLCFVLSSLFPTQMSPY